MSKDVAKRDRRELAELAVRSVMLRREGYDWDDIASRVGVTVLEAKEMARVGYGRLSEQTADEVRVEIEDRINDVIRKANLDLKLADSQASRTALYRVILAAEAQRSRLLGLNLRGGDDADSED